MEEAPTLEHSECRYPRGYLYKDNETQSLQNALLLLPRWKSTDQASTYALLFTTDIYHPTIASQVCDLIPLFMYYYLDCSSMLLN